MFARSTRGLGRSGKLDPIVTQPTDLGVQYKSYTLLSPLEDRCPPLVRNDPVLRRFDHALTMSH